MVTVLASPPRNAQGQEQAASKHVVIKKYANRRLYNTATSAYVTLDHIQSLVHDGTDFSVVDAKSGEDITRSILTQIILEAENSGQNLLPVDFLRNIIRSYGDSVQGYLPSYLDLAMKSFAESREQFAKSLTGTFELATPVAFFQKAVQANMAMMESAARAFTSNVKPSKTSQTPSDTIGSSNELDVLRAQMEAMKARLDRLDGKDT